MEDARIQTGIFPAKLQTSISLPERWYLWLASFDKGRQDCMLVGVFCFQRAWDLMAAIILNLYNFWINSSSPFHKTGIGSHGYYRHWAIEPSGPVNTMTFAPVCSQVEDAGSEPWLMLVLLLLEGPMEGNSAAQGNGCYRDQLLWYMMGALSTSKTEGWRRSKW